MNDKVFSSNITRSQHSQKNDLYDLIQIVPARPLKNNEIRNTSACNFFPRTDKFYIPKKKYNRIKVKTVTDIREEFERDTYSYLNSHLERQDNILLKKISSGLSGDEATKTQAKNILKADEPISRSSLEMLININPYNHNSPKQYILYKGKYIQLNGSLGGKNKLIYNYDLAIQKSIKKKCFKNKYIRKTKGLLRNSLDVKFKPGPLGLKRLLDDSHQKYHVGDIVLVDLPNPGLDIQPSYGTALDPSITHLLNSLRKDDGTIEPKWAEFAASVLGTIEKSNAVLVSNDYVTFNFNYKYDQSRILMRQDLDSRLKEFQPNNLKENCFDIQDYQSVVLPEITDIMNKILDSVEISVIQNDICRLDEDILDSVCETSNIDERNMGTCNQKDKHKKRYGELGRLDVTVINIPDVTIDNKNYVCEKSFCVLGCICQSLAITHNIKYHCGRVECMFDCTCNFAKYKGIDTLETNGTHLMPALVNIDRAININLAKEEKKFHQTVIVSGKKRILLKSEKRNWKASKKYADFYSKMCLKNQDKTMLDLAIVSPKLDLNNVEIWCMVHNLYRCFCKGRFTETRMSDLKETSNKELSQNNVMSDLEPISGYRNISTVPTANVRDTTGAESAKAIEENRKTRSSRRLKDSSALWNQSLTTSKDNEDDNDSSCSRVTQYCGRKYSKDYYRFTNAKIFEMEKNDKTLQRRLLTTFKCVEEVQNVRKKVLVLPNTNSLRHGSGSFKCVEEVQNVHENVLVLPNTKSLRHSSGSFKCVEEVQNVRENVLVLPNTKSLRHSSETCYPKSTPTGDDLYKKLAIPTIQIDASKNPNDSQNMSPSGTKLVNWLVSNYQKFKNQVDKRKAVLLPPENGKIALYSWEFILQRYREHKNVFMVSKQMPFRLYMAVHAKDNFFNNCININEIRFLDLNKYPQSVKNLLTNSTGLEDSFCVLRGLKQCWEFVGSITKTAPETKEETLTTNMLSTEPDINTDSIDNYEDETNLTTVKRISTDNVQCVAKKIPDMKRPDINTDSIDYYADETNLTTVKRISTDNVQYVAEKIPDMKRPDINTDSIDYYADETNLTTVKRISIDNVQCVATKIPDMKRLDSIETFETSKWFVMTVENDFTELQFYRKGFFVTFEKIVNAINVARVTGKTVRLSSNKCDNKNNNPQFGIYAISCKNEHCVFIGPYEFYDTLGIELVKNVFSVRPSLRRTRGFWLNTNKIDNDNVISDPMSFMTKDLNNEVDLLDNLIEVTDSCKTGEVSSKKVQPVKIIKTTKISLPDKNDKASELVEFKSITKPLSIHSNGNFVSKSPTLPIENIQAELDPLCDNKYNERKTVRSNYVTKQIRILDVYSMPNEENLEVDQDDSKILDDNETTSKAKHLTKSKGFESGMFVLKPEEINRKLLKLNVNNLSLNNSDAVSMYNKNVRNYLSYNCADAAVDADTVDADTSDSDLGQDYELEIRAHGIFGEPSREHENENEITSQQQHDSTEDCYILSSDEEPQTPFKIVWLQSEIGWVKGAIDQREYISYKLRGCNDSKFYPMQELPGRINTDIHKHTFHVLPKSVKLALKWNIVSSAWALTGREIEVEQLPSLKKLLLKHIVGSPRNADICIKKLVRKPSIGSNQCTEEPQKLVKTYSKRIPSTCTITSRSLIKLQNTSAELCEEGNDISTPGSSLLVEDDVNMSIKPRLSLSRQESAMGACTRLNINSLLERQSDYAVTLGQILTDQQHLMNSPEAESEKTAEEDLD